MYYDYRCTVIFGGKQPKVVRSVFTVYRNDGCIVRVARKINKQKSHGRQLRTLAGPLGWTWWKNYCVIIVNLRWLKKKCNVWIRVFLFHFLSASIIVE